MAAVKASDLALSGLTKVFGTTTAVDRVTLRIAAGEMVALLGPSGCGKTTTLMSIAGFRQPDAVRICCGERVLFDRSHSVNVPAEDRNLGIVFQSYAI